MKRKKITIDELEAILKNEEQLNIHIHPDGSISAHKRKQRKKPKVKMLTLKQALGGEYGEAVL